MTGKRVAAGLVATTAVIGLAFGAGTASAGTASAGTTTATTGDAPVVAAGTWHYFNEYRTADACLTTGDRGMGAGRWQAFRCPKKSTGTYLLYVWY
ncbi:hypothetical protein [Actinosynnema sp. NPDC023587]|uniref:hypothetical protein n=1 Tax=Actinosynnema sp. NPDC023587 TaxID=3154695 RepID=UPI0033FD699F